jgi:hypothetical protein
LARKEREALSRGSIVYLVLWIEVCPQNSNTEALTLTVTIFGIMRQLRLNEGGVQIQQDSLLLIRRNTEERPQKKHKEKTATYEPTKQPSPEL